MEKKSFKERLKSMSVKRKIVALFIIVAIIAIPVSAVAYQLNQKKPTKTAANSSKSGTNKSTGGSNSKDGGKKGSTQAGSNAQGSARPTQSRLDRFNKDTIAKRIEQAKTSKRITDAQAKLLNKKLSDIEKFVKSNKSKSPQDLIKIIGDKRKELQKWAEDNNIPSRYVAGWL